MIQLCLIKSLIIHGQSSGKLIQEKQKVIIQICNIYFYALVVHICKAIAYINFYVIGIELSAAA